MKTSIGTIETIVEGVARGAFSRGPKMATTFDMPVSSSAENGEQFEARIGDQVTLLDGCEGEETVDVLVVAQPDRMLVMVLENTEQGIYVVNRGIWPRSS